MEILITTQEHINGFIENITKEDLNEYEAYKKYVIFNEDITLFDHLTLACQQYQVYTLIHNDSVIAIGGDVNGNSWFLTSNVLGTLTKEQKKEFIEIMNQHKEKVLDESGIIWNYVWEGNITHLRFLKRIGAEFPSDTVNVPEQFKYFEIRRD
ncbi:TPA: DUF2833 domain-containing protein [Klebsiella variicola subsp. variicola]|nr:DUF2833 domain-containing protein [Klebsiella variicola subsp. variicola]